MLNTTGTSRGVLLMLGFCILAPLLDASTKLATEAIPVGQITAARFVFQGLWQIPCIARNGLGAINAISVAMIEKTCFHSG